MKGFPLSFQKSFLLAHSVSYFWCAESQREFRKLSVETRVNIGDEGFPVLATCLP